MECQSLSEFTQVEVLEIRKDTISDLHDCCYMISLLPKLQKVIAVLPLLSLAKLLNTEQTHNKEIVKYGNFTDISYVSLENFVPKNEQDLSFLMNRFPNLKNFLIVRDRYMPVWLFKKHIPLSALRGFFRFIQLIDPVNICFSVDDRGWFLENYYAYHGSLTERGQSSPVRVTLSNDDQRYPDHVRLNRLVEYPIYITLEDNSNTEITLEFRDAVSKSDTRKHIITQKKSICCRSRSRYKIYRWRYKRRHRTMYKDHYAISTQFKMFKIFVWKPTSI